MLYVALWLLSLLHFPIEVSIIFTNFSIVSIWYRSKVSKVKRYFSMRFSNGADISELLVKEAVLLKRVDLSD